MYVWIQCHFTVEVGAMARPLSTIHRPKSMTEAEATAREEIEKSTQAIREIDWLTASAEFGSYRVKIERKAEELAETVLEGNVGSEEREELRQQRIGLLSGLRMLANDREGHASILRGHGIDV